jgi:hypothetical protein
MRHPRWRNPGGSARGPQRSGGAGERRISSLWRTRAAGTVPVSDAPRRWPDCQCTVPLLADADSCRLPPGRRLYPQAPVRVASPLAVAAGTRVYARLETLNFPSPWELSWQLEVRELLDWVPPKPGKGLSARSDARSCDRRLLQSCARPFRAPPSLPLGTAAAPDMHTVPARHTAAPYRHLLVAAAVATQDRPGGAGRAPRAVHAFAKFRRQPPGPGHGSKPIKITCCAARSRHAVYSCPPTRSAS